MISLSVRGLCKTYGGAPALDAVDLDVPAGSRTAVVGPSGSGKTTLLRVVAGFETPDRGCVALDGRVITDAATLVPTHRRAIGFVPQDGGLFPHLNVAENIGFGLDRALADRHARICALMDVVDLDRSFLKRQPHELSGGQQQRVALARALARQPKLMLLDEPFSALDAGKRADVRQAVGRVLREAGITTVLVTHDQAEALSFADQVVVLRDGCVAQTGAPRDVYLRPRDRATAEFLGDAIIVPAELGEGFADCRLGRIPAETGGRRGRVEIMVRPEQLQLLPADAPTPARAGDVLAEVTSAEFAGAVGTATLALAPARGAAARAAGPADLTARLVVPCFGIEVPAVGSFVRVLVRGTAHVLVEES